MKWKTINNRPQEGDTRTVRKFALFPTTCGEYTVWLETYDSFQVYRNAKRATKAGTVMYCAWDEIRRDYLVLYP